MSSTKMRTNRRLDFLAFKKREELVLELEYSILRRCEVSF